MYHAWEASSQFCVLQSLTHWAPYLTWLVGSPGLHLCGPVLARGQERAAVAVHSEVRAEDKRHRVPNPRGWAGVRFPGAEREGAHAA